MTEDSIHGPRVWLKADINLLSEGWSDVGPFNNHAQALTPSGLPALKGDINFNPSFQFDGIDDFLKIPVCLESLTELSFFAIVSSADTTERGIFGTENSSRTILLTTRNAIGPDTITDRYGNYEDAVFLTSLVQNWEGPSSLSSGSSLALGSAGTGRNFKPFKGKISEIVLFDRALSFTERAQFETYLAIKYGTGLMAGNFLSSNNEVLWRVSENKTHGFHIGGIGRDDFFHLHQRQSHSAYDSGLIVMSVGPLATSNANNQQSITDQNFILWGSNGAPLTQMRGEGQDSVLSYLQRRWLVTVSGEMANTMATELRVDATQFAINDPLNYWMVIDRSGQGNFSVDNLEYVMPAQIVDGKMIFKNLVWDNDGSGKDYFGFVRAVDLLAVVKKINDPSCTNVTGGQIRVEIISGKAPFQISLSNPAAKLAKHWRESANSREQNDLVSGNYTLEIIDGNKDKLVRQFELVMPDAIAINLGEDQIFSEENPIVLSVSSQIPQGTSVSYRWENSFGFSSEEQSITVPEPGIYRVFVTNVANACTFSDVVAISGSDFQRIAVYPTVLRVGENYNVGLSMEEPGSVSVAIFNARGIEITTMEGSGQSEYQFISNVKDPGIYLVVIRTPKGTETRKIAVY